MRGRIGVRWGRAGVLFTWSALSFVVSAGCGGGQDQVKEPDLVADPPLTDSASSKGAASSHIGNGRTAIENNQFAEAKIHLEKAVSIDPKNAEAVGLLALAKDRLGDKKGAEEDYKKAIALDPQATGASANLAALYLEEPARPDEAIKILKDALAKNPKDPTLRENLAFAYSLKGDTENASKQYDAIIAGGGDSVQVRMAYGSLLLQAKEKEKATEQLRKALAGAEKDGPVLATLGRMFSVASAHGDCVKAFDAAIAVEASNPDNFVQRGLCRHSLKDEAGARADYEAAIKAKPDHALAHYYLGYSWLLDKKYDTARIELGKALKLGEGTNIAKLARQKLDEMPKK
jgi:Flp pilus assembly protein TadD